MKSTFKRFVRPAQTVLMLVILLTGCNPKEVEPKPDLDLTTFEGVIEQGGSFEPVVVSEQVSIIAEDVEEVQNGEAWKCTTKTYSIVDGNDDFPLFNPNASVIYPGSLLQGNSLDQATPNVIVVKRLITGYWLLVTGY